jgi:hypothetical protein
MPNYDKKRPYNTNLDQSDDKDELERDTWSPTPAQYEDFAKKDYQFARENVKQILTYAGRPSTLREIKESSLHSLDCIERVLTSMVAAAYVVEAKGRYTLAK